MTNDKKIEWILRIGVAGEFLGHGVFAVLGKADWIKWISQMANVDTGVATTMLTVIGILDVIVAIIVLIKPVKPVLLWAALWGFWTALVRPLVGNTADIFSLSSPWLDFIERFANWAAPLALYFFYKNKK